jgi:SAM-dependent methyltransferase
MSKQLTKGYDDRVHVFRAKPQGGADLDNDASTMVQEQIARIKYFLADVNLQGRSLLDWGCGTGFNCEYARTKYGVSRTLGVDISAPTIQFARQTYPDCEYVVGDVCDPNLDVGNEEWDYVICCEVFEHVHDVHALLDGIYRHLRPGGTAFISTPNRPVFSLNHVPSPLNQTHIKEYCLDEFSEILSTRFGSVKISGQRLSDPVMEKRRVSVMKRRVMDYRILKSLYWNSGLRIGWKILRLEPLLRWMEGPERYDHNDFEFVEPVGDDSIWLCATVTK